MHSSAELRGNRAARRGSALLLSMFTVAALLVLGTTFIAIAIGESRQTRGDKDSQLARSVAMYGVNFAASYMAVPSYWSDQNNLQFGADKLWQLQPNASNNKINWLGRTLDLSPPSVDQYGNYTWTVTADPSVPPPAAQVDLSNEGEVGVFSVNVELLSPNAPGQWYLNGQPQQYAITSTGYIFHVDDVGAIYNGPNNGVDETRALATRSVTVRVRPQNPLDFAIYEANMRSWNTPGFNSLYGTSNLLDNGLGTIDPSQYPAGSAAAQQAAFEQQLLQNMFNQVQLDTIGIPTNFTMSGNLRADGSSTVGDPFAGVSGSIHVFATNSSDLASIHFTGQTGFDSAQTAANPTVQPNLYDGSFTNQQKNSIFQNGPTFSATRGLPAVAGYMTSWVADTTAGTPTVSSPDPISLMAGSVTEYAQNPPGGQQPLGYIKVGTPSSGPVAVNSSTVTGSDVEILDPRDSSTPPVQQPGFARVVVTFNGSSVSIQKIGAYSGMPVDTSTPPFDQPYSASSFPNGLIYVDGGNVEIHGQAPGGLTVVAAASSDRPTTATPAVEQNGTLTPQSGLPILITPAQQDQISTSIYRDANFQTSQGALFQTDASGAITNIPAFDADDQKWYFPAYDPTRIGTLSGDANAVTSTAPLVREGNISITGDLTKASGNSAPIGLVAQNFILLSDQRQNNPSNTLNVDAALMSMQQSVQYGGFMNAGFNDYWHAMGVTPAANGSVQGSIPIPVNAVTNGRFVLNGSIVGQYADVESTRTGGIGYTTQSINPDPTLQSALPPLFPNFSRGTERVPIVWVVVAVTDSGALKSGTVSTAPAF